MLLCRLGELVMRCGSAVMFVVLFVASVTFAQTPSSVATDVIPGHIISKTPAQYPAVAKLAHLEGQVVIKARIGKDGHVSSLTAVSGPDVLQKAAIDAVRQWVYTPYTRGGEPVEVETVITMNFNITPFDKMPKGRVIVPSSVMAGLLVTRVKPQYPDDQLSARISATVAVRLVIGRSGKVEEAFPISGDPDFRQAAIDCVMQWEYKPYAVKGKAVEVVTDVFVPFGTLAQ